MRRALSAALVGVAAAGLVLAVAAPASAHNWVVSSTPAEGEVLTELPDAWEIATNENLLYAGNDEVFGLLVRDADGLYYGDGCVDVSGPDMTAAPVIGEAGSYELLYTFISADGHPLSGEIPFEWAPAGEFEAATGSATVPTCGAAVEEPEEPAADGEQPAGGIPGDVWWIVVAVFAVVVAVVLTVVVARRRPRED